MTRAALRHPFDVAPPREVALLSAVHGENEFFSLSLPPLLPLLIADFDLSYAAAGLLATVYFVMYTVFQLPAGVVADRVGKRRLVALGTVVLSIGVLLSSAAPTYLALAGAQAVAGIGGSTYHPAGMSLIADVEGVETEGRAMGLHGLGGILGTILAPVVLGGLAAVFDWRAALAAASALGFAAALAFAVASLRSPDRGEPVADGAGRDGRERKGSDARRPGRGAVDGDRRAVEGGRGSDAGGRGADDGNEGSVEGDGGSVASVRDGSGSASGEPGPAGAAGQIARRFGVPLAPWVLGLVLLKLLFSLQSGAVRTYTTAYLFARLGGSTTLSNAVFFVLLAGSALATVWFGTVSDRLDRRRLLVGTFFGAGAMVAATALVPSRPAILVGWFFVLGVAVYASLPVINTLAAQHSRRETSGGLFGVVQTGSATGSAISPVLFGAVATEFGIAAAVPSAAVVCVLAGAMVLAFGGRLFETGPAARVSDRRR